MKLDDCLKTAHSAHPGLQVKQQGDKGGRLSCAHGGSKRTVLVVRQRWPDLKVAFAGSHEAGRERLAARMPCLL